MAEPGPVSPWAPPAPIITGEGGVSAAKEYERRRAKMDQQIEARWGTGRLGRIAKTLADEPQSTAAWSKGAVGERKLGDRMALGLDGAAIVLNDRKVPGTKGNIDHLVVSSSGVWVIDAKNYSGRVEMRDVGGWFRADHRLFVANRDKSKLADGMAWQVEKVRTVLEPIGFAAVAVHPVLCFTNSEWPLFARPFIVRGVTATWPAKLIESIAEPGPLDQQTVRLIAHQLSTTLPAASAA